LAAGALALGLGGAAAAELTETSETGFVVAFSFETAATPEQTWETLVTPSLWWSSDHSYSGDAANFSLEVAPGGCFCETWDRGAVKHGEVVQFFTGAFLRIEGGLGPLQNLAVGQVQDWTIEATAGGSKVSYLSRVSGRAEDGLVELAPVVDMVIGEQVGRLERYLATGSAE
jgi:uncharacterized protein YndB with AHSA1/START domain